MFSGLLKVMAYQTKYEIYMKLKDVLNIKQVL